MFLSQTFFLLQCILFKFQRPVRSLLATWFHSILVLVSLSPSLSANGVSTCLPSCPRAAERFCTSQNCFERNLANGWPMVAVSAFAPMGTVQLQLVTLPCGLSGCSALVHEVRLLCFVFYVASDSFGRVQDFSLLSNSLLWLSHSFKCQFYAQSTYITEAWCEK